MNRAINILLLLSFCLQMGCGVVVPLTHNKDKLSELELLMTQQKVRSRVGDPDEVRGSIKNVDGDIVTVWQYDLYNKSSGWTNFALGFFLVTLPWWIAEWPYNRPGSYWLYFVGDKLARWGKAGDWQPDVIMQIRIKND